MWAEYLKKRSPIIGYWAITNLIDSLITARDQTIKEKREEDISLTTK
jgi:hypothetical protein